MAAAYPSGGIPVASVIEFTSSVRVAAVANAPEWTLSAVLVTRPSPVTSASRRSRRVQRKADGKYRTAARVVSRVDATAVEARVLPGDRQAQAAALGTRPRRVGFEEPVEYMRDRGGGQPSAVVSYFHGQLPAARAVRLGAGRHGHRLAAMSQGVADAGGPD